MGLERPALAAVGGGREELRASLLRPYLLRLRVERGGDAVRELLGRAGMRRSEVERDGSWIPLLNARRALRELSEVLGEKSLDSWGAYAVQPEVLGAYVRLLRTAKTPIDAYRYLAENSNEQTRVGEFELDELGPHDLVMRYRARTELDSDADLGDQSLCCLWQAELRAMTRFWGLREADVEKTACMTQGDPACSYRVHWRELRRPLLPLGITVGALSCGAAVALSGNLLATGIAAGVGALLGGGGGALGSRLHEDRTARVFERHRIAALEHGLDQRGQFRDTQGALANTVLGGKYRIQKKIGSGGIGAVYAAEHLGLGYQVAIKVLRGAAAVDASEIARLRREARVQVSIEHPNVVRTLDLDQMPDGSLFVVMELLQGVSLQERLADSGPLAPGFATPAFMQVCRALSAAHRLGIIHRDLKPGNIFLGDDQVVKVLDFGMSKLAEADALTQDGYTLGTPEYMSPEQCVGAPVDPRSDIYAFGALMYEALTGQLPLIAKSRRDLLEMHQRTIPRPMRQVRPDLEIPPDLDRIVMACLKKRAAERPESAQHLERLLASIPPQGLVYEYPPHTPRHLKVATAVDSSSTRLYHS